MRGVLFFVVLGLSFLLLQTCSDGASHAREAQRIQQQIATREVEQAHMADIIPPVDVRPIEPKAIKQADSIKPAAFCHALGKALRGNDRELERAMIQRTADLQLGYLKLAQQDAIRKHQVQLGMTDCMATASWGRPERINRSAGSYGTREQWVYPSSYLYFEDGVLTSWQVQGA